MQYLLSSKDLYKSVWHEWEGCFKTKSTNGNTEETTTTQQIQPNEVTVKQRLNSPNKQQKGRETKKRKKKKKKKKQKQKENSKVEDKAVVSVIRTFILYPILSPWRILLDLMRLAIEIISSTIRLVRQKLSRKRQIDIVPKRTKNKKDTKKKRKNSSYLHMFRRQYLSKRYFQNLFLLCHVLKEVHVILSLLRSYWISPDVSLIHRANASLALGLAGVNLFWNKKYPRNDFTSKVLFWILSQYHLTSLSVSLMIDNGQCSISFVQQSDKSGTRSFYWSFFDGITNENWYDLYNSV